MASKKDYTGAPATSLVVAPLPYVKIGVPKEDEVAWARHATPEEFKGFASAMAAGTQYDYFEAWFAEIARRRPDLQLGQRADGTPVGEYPVRIRFAGGDGLKWCDFGIERLDPARRRLLLNAAKDHPGGDDALSLVLNSDAVACFPVPGVGRGGEVEKMTGRAFARAAGEVLERATGLLHVFWDDEMPEFPDSCSYYWFHTSPDWSAVEPSLGPPFAHKGWTEQSGIDDVPLRDLSVRWARLASLFHISRYFTAWIDPQKQKEYLAAGNAYVKKEAEKAVRDATDEQPADGGPRRFDYTAKAPHWLLEGAIAAYRRELNKIEDELQADTNRLTRSIRIFVESFSLPEAHKFLSLAMCLEALLSLGNSDLTFQLSCRLGWLGAPSSPEERMTIAKAVGKLYDTRSKIIHGAPFAPKNLYDQTDELASLCRRVILSIIDNDEMFRVYGSDQKEEVDKFLKRLALGAWGA